MTEETNEKPTIAYDDFVKLDLRVATVTEVSEHPNADRLIVLKLDLGNGQTRQIVAGIKAWYSPEALIGKQIVIVKNLEPRKMRGIESQGMLLAASSGDEDARDVVVLTVDKPVAPGSSVS